MKVEKINYSEGLAIKYCVRNSQGRYSTGGAYPGWRNFERAKIWNSMGSLKGHLNMFSEIPPDWEIVLVINQIQEPGLNAKKVYDDHLLKKNGIMKLREAKSEKLKIEREMEILLRRLSELKNI